MHECQPRFYAYSVEDLNIEVLFDDPLVVVAGAQSAWTRRRKVDLADLIDEPWILSPPGTLTHACVAEAFKARELEGPRASLVTFANDLRAKLVSRGPFITAVPRSVLRLDGDRPIHFDVGSWEVKRTRFAHSEFWRS